ncbi:MAG: DUF1592 domain-containing protein [Planctomycetes bacterium]|nr:DUF1592 domain-containing protein [Planctomycetota bacterium]
MKPPAWMLALGAVVALGASETPPDFAHDIRPLLETHCFECHGPDKHKGDVNLANYDSLTAVQGALPLWRSVGNIVRSGEMPPPSAKAALSEADRAKLARWAASIRFGGAADPGRVTLHRLNRAEYDNTIRDLFGLDLDAAAAFPTDDTGEGFDNIADVLSLSPLLLEKYLAASERIAARVIALGQVSVRVGVDAIAASAGGKPLAIPVEDGARTLTDGGELAAPLFVSSDGKYTLKIKAGADQAGNEPVRMAVRIDDRVVKEFRVVSKRGSPGAYTVTGLPISRGTHSVALIFLNPFSGESAPGKPAKRALAVQSIELVGAPAPAKSETHRRLVVAEPSAELPKREAARAVLARLLPRAFRRPASAEEIDRLLALFDAADQAGEPYEGALRLVVQAVLVSPSFLYRVEPDGKAGSDGIYRLDGHQVASRLSYFLWSSMPDEALFAAAAKGDLDHPEKLDAEVRRMLRDPKARALVDGFADQWLLVRNLEELELDPKQFPEFDKGLRRAMADEALLFFEAVMREDRSILEFVNADWTFVNDKLAKVYAISGVSGPQMRKVTLIDPNRGGVLGMAAIMAVTSNPARTSPARRGKFILEQLLDDPPPPPPANAGTLPEKSEATAGLTTRQLLERHRSDPTCASCHVRLDPLGFALEAYDPIGRYRTKDGGLPVDTASVMTDGTRINGARELKTILLQTRRIDFARCLVSKLLTYALGRGLQPYDEPTVDAIVKDLEADGWRFSSLVTGIARSYPFLHRRIRSSP